MYTSVAEYFHVEYPDLQGILNNPGEFWPAVKDNTILNATLERNKKVYEDAGKFTSAVYRASVALMTGRLVGKVANPG